MLVSHPPKYLLMHGQIPKSRKIPNPEQFRSQAFQTRDTQPIVQHLRQDTRCSLLWGSEEPCFLSEGQTLDLVLTPFICDFKPGLKVPPTHAYPHARSSLPVKSCASQETPILTWVGHPALLPTSAPVHATLRGCREQWYSWGMKVDPFHAFGWWVLPTSSNELTNENLHTIGFYVQNE
jgi:hypothetical protein